MTNTAATDATAFITRWQDSGAAERANYQLFLSELCDVLSVPRPDPTRPEERDNAYVFEKSVVFDHGDGTHTTKFIDLYKRSCFVLEAKQGSDAGDETPALFAAPPRGRRGTAVRGTTGWDSRRSKEEGPRTESTPVPPQAKLAP